MMLRLSVSNAAAIYRDGKQKGSQAWVTGAWPGHAKSETHVWHLNRDVGHRHNGGHQGGPATLSPEPGLRA